MNLNFVPSEENDDIVGSGAGPGLPEPPADDKDPLEKDRVHREYSSPEKNFEGVAPEAPPLSDEPGGSTAGPTEPGPEPEPSPSSSGGQKGPMPPKFKKRSSARLAEHGVKAYAEYVPKFLKWAAPIDDNKLGRLATSGAIDFGVPYTTPDGQVMPAGQFLMAVNEGLRQEELFNVSNDWCTEMQAAFTEYLQEKNVGMTPGQQVAALLIEDFGVKCAILIGVKIQMMNMLKFFKEQTALRAEEAAAMRAAEAREARERERERQTPPPAEDKAPTFGISDAVIIEETKK